MQVLTYKKLSITEVKKSIPFFDSIKEKLKEQIYGVETKKLFDRLETILKKFESYNVSFSNKNLIPDTKLYNPEKGVVANLIGTIEWIKARYNGVDESQYLNTIQTRDLKLKDATWEDSIFDTSKSRIHLVLNNKIHQKDLNLNMNSYLDYVMYHELAHHYQIWRMTYANKSTLIELTQSNNSYLNKDQNYLFNHYLLSSDYIHKTMEKPLRYQEHYQTLWREQYADIMAICLMLKDNHDLSIIHNVYKQRNNDGHTHRTEEALIELLTEINKIGLNNIKNYNLEDMHLLASSIVEKQIIKDMDGFIKYPDKHSSLEMNHFIKECLSRVIVLDKDHIIDWSKSIASESEYTKISQNKLYSDSLYTKMIIDSKDLKIDLPLGVEKTTYFQY